MAYNCTIISKLPSGGRLQYDGEEFKMIIDEREVTIKTIGSEKNIKDSSWIKFSCVGFDSELQAHKHGRALKARLTYAAMKGGPALDVGRDTVISAPFKPLIDAAKRKGAQLLPSVHGLMVYQSTGRDIQLFANPTVLLGTSVDNLESGIRSVEHLQIPSSGSQLELACELYIQAAFESSPRARFITLVTALEALASQEEHEGRLVSIIKRFEGQLKIELSSLEPPVEPTTIDSLKGRLKDLRRESIGSSLRKLAKAHGEPPYGDIEIAERFMTHVYDLRGDIVHGEINPKTRDLPLAETNRLTAEIILGVAASP